MGHISDWHDLNHADRSTYPRTVHPIQVCFVSGEVQEGDSAMFFPKIGPRQDSQITGWRYIRD